LEVENSKKIEERSEGNLVKKTCEKLGINQKQLAEKTGFTVQTLSRWNKNNSLIPKSSENFLKTLLELEKYKQFVLKQVEN